MHFFFLNIGLCENCSFERECFYLAGQRSLVSQRATLPFEALSMVRSDSVAMGNGSIKAPRLEETCLASGVKESPVWEPSEQLRLRIAWLEEELTRRDHELRAQELQLQALQRELEAKVSQIDKLQDAIGYNSLGRSPPARHSHRLLSVINQGSTRFHRVAVEVHRRLKAKEGVSAEPTSGKFYSGHKVHHVSTERTRIRKDSG